MTFAKDYLHGAEGMFASWGAGGARRFFHSDHLGSPRLITGDGFRPDAVLGRRSYFPYGVDVSTAGHYDDRICKFTGHERDVHNTTDYMMARSYAYPIQRFTSPDPGRDGWNLYAYVGNSPMNYVDPSGKERAGIQLDRDAQALLSGEIGREQYVENIQSRGVAAAAGASLFVPGPEDVAIGTAVARFGGRLLGRLGKFASKLLGKSDEGATVVSKAGAEAVGQALEGLRTGSSPRVGMVDSAEELGELYGRLIRGGKPVESTKYPGQVVKLPDGTTVGLRGGSKSGGPTIDIKLPDGTLRKVHVQQ